jgi:hypothetical protein
MKRRSERPLSGFSLTPEEEADILCRTQLARASETYKQREANTALVPPVGWAWR